MPGKKLVFLVKDQHLQHERFSTCQELPFIVKYWALFFKSIYFSGGAW